MTLTAALLRIERVIKAAPERPLTIALAGLTIPEQIKAAAHARALGWLALFEHDEGAAGKSLARSARVTLAPIRR